MSAAAPATNSQQETEVVTGTITGIIQKGADKWQVACQAPDSQYPRNLWTKDANLVAQLSMMIGQTASFMCGVSHWTNQQGAPVRSLWINGVGPAGAMPQAQAMPTQQGGFQNVPQPNLGFQAPQPTPTFTPPQQEQPVTHAAPAYITDQMKQGMIHRQTASKVASILISHMPTEERTFDTLITLCERLVAYYDHGLAGLGQVAQPAFGAAGAEDDIPF